MYYSYVEIEYVATSFSPTRTDLALKLLRVFSGDQYIVLDSGFKITNYYKHNTETTQPYVILIINPPQQIIYSP
jgi:hypothetical protein